MFLKRCKNEGASEENEWYLPKGGGLKSSHIHLSLASHHGIPRTSSKLSFDPTQRLLAVGTLDGRIKLIGRDGVEGILLSNSQSRCKFLEFANNQGIIVNITSENVLQIWDLELRVLAQTHRWHTNITAFSVIQGSPFMYIGEDSGDVAVLQYDKEGNKLRQMPYSIPLHATFGGIEGSSYDNSPSVIDILPFPETDHRRVLIAYSSGLIIVWGIYDAQVLAVKAYRATQENQLGEEGVQSSSSEEGEDKDICCICWADLCGDLLAVGYTDGDIWLWDLAVTSSRSSNQSSAPLVKLQLSSDKSRSPVLALHWCAAGAREGMVDVDGGYLFMYGGGDFGCSEALTIFSLKTAGGHLDAQNFCHVNLPLEGLFDDMILLPRAGGTLVDAVSAILVLTSQGQLHAYDAVSIRKCFLDMEEGSASSLPEPVPVNPFITEPSITVIKIAELPANGKAVDVFSQLPRCLKGNLPSFLPGGTKWPITGGILSKPLAEGSQAKAVLITGHADGSVNVWDTSVSVVSLLCNLSASIMMQVSETIAASVSHLEFCPCNGILVVAQSSGVVFIYKLSSESGEVKCRFWESSNLRDQELSQDAGFHCVAVLNLDIAAVSSLAVANHSDHVAVGYANGTVLLFDVGLCTIMSNDMVFPNGQTEVVSLTFGPQLKTSAPIESLTASPSSPILSKPLQQGVVYALADNLSVIAMVYDNGKAITSGPWHVDHPSKALYLHCLEFSNEQKDKKKTGPSKQSLEDMIDVDKYSTADLEAEDLSSCFLLLCTQSSVYLYRSSVSNKVVSLASLKTESFSTCCFCASAFVTQGANACGLVLLDISGTLQIRSLPDLDIVEQFSLAGIYNLDPKISEKSTLVCGNKGLMALVDVKRELIIFSILSEDENWTADTAVCFFDKDVAAAADAALKAGAHPTRRKSQIQNFIGGVLKDLKGGVLKEIKGGFLKASKNGKDQSTRTNVPANLSTLFASLPVAEKIVSPRLDKTFQSESAGRLDKAFQSESAGSASELDIDDIDIEEEGVSPGHEPGSSEKLAASLKGKEKLSDASDDRIKLFGGEEDHSKPVRRSPDEIRAKYGHKSSGDVSGAAGLARDKLLERQEKLQALGKRTEEMQEGAENFALMAAELAKAMEGRKWWQL